MSSSDEESYVAPVALEPEEEIWIALTAEPESEEEEDAGPTWGKPAQCVSPSHAAHCRSGTRCEPETRAPHRLWDAKGASKRKSTIRERCRCTAAVPSCMAQCQWSGVPSRSMAHWPV